jgi:hypothetical protein
MTDNLPAALPPPSTNLESLAQACEGEALALLVETMRDKDQKIEHRLKAANDVLDRARGKPKVAAPKDPNAAKKTKAISMSIETLMRIAQGGMARVAAQEHTRRQGEVLEAEFVAQPRKRPVNEHATRPSLQSLPQPTAPDSDTDDLLS